MSGAALAALIVALAAPAAALEWVLEEGEQQRIAPGASVRRVAVGDPDIADVQLLSAREILLTAKSVGSTTLWIWSGADEPERARVRVLPPAAAANIVAVDAQVQIDIRIVETSRRVLRQAGIQSSLNDLDRIAALSPPGLLSAVSRSGPGAPFLLESAGGFLPIAQAFNLVYGESDRGILGVISVLERHGLASVLAEPSLVATSGQTASFLVGGEVPVPVIQNASGANGSVSIEYKEFGIRVRLSPTVLAPDRIGLRVAPEVSELDFANAVEAAGVSVPALRTRRADTSIELGDGESLVIGGLVSRSLAANVDKVPGLGDIPVLGAFFKSSRFDREDRELIMIVSPHLIRPIAKGETLPTLPGERARAYDPAAYRLFLLETGSFEGAGTGFWE